MSNVYAVKIIVGGQEYWYCRDDHDKAAATPDINERFIFLYYDDAVKVSKKYDGIIVSIKD